MKCDDPYWYGCTADADYYRPHTYQDKPDMPQYLCIECLECLKEANKDDQEIFDEFIFIDDNYR